MDSTKIFRKLMIKRGKKLVEIIGGEINEQKYVKYYD